LFCLAPFSSVAALIFFGLGQRSLKERQLKLLSLPMKCSARRKCQHCKEFYLPDRRNLHHQRYCSEVACRRQSKAESQRRWAQKPDNQNYFSGPQNSQRVKEWRKRNPGYWRKKSPPPQEPLQDLCRTQVAQDEEVKTIEISTLAVGVRIGQPGDVRIPVRSQGILRRSAS
jgi:hypothetical protein